MKPEYLRLGKCRSRVFCYIHFYKFYDNVSFILNCYSFFYSIFTTKSHLEIITWTLKRYFFRRKSLWCFFFSKFKFIYKNIPLIQIENETDILNTYQECFRSTSYWQYITYLLCKIYYYFLHKKYKIIHNLDEFK